MKKGFTLIELLAVIVVLAIISLIATPIVINIMNNAKKISLENSARTVLSAIRTEIFDNMLVGDFEVPSYWTDANLNLDGEKPICLNLQIDNSTGKINSGEIRFVSGTVVISESGTVESSKTKLENNDENSCGLSYILFDSSNLKQSDLVFADSKSDVTNPYRGLYYMESYILPSESTDASVNQTNENNFSQYAKNHVAQISGNASVGMVVFYLKNYRDVNKLPNSVLNILDAYLEVFRQEGYKLIVRFAYGDYYGVGDSKEPDDFNTILGHLSQLSPFFEKNKDVIQLVQLGFIGPWGEMHSTDYSVKNYINQLVDVALESVPYPLQVSLRRPQFYRDYFNDTSLFDESLKYTNNNKARVAIFNDAFLTSPTDMGTYADGQRQYELNWQNSLTKYTFFGGEFATYLDSNENYSSMNDAIDELRALHINYLNSADNNGTFNNWQNSVVTEEIDSDWAGTTFYNYVKEHLGYRFVIEDALVPQNDIERGGILNFKLVIKNVGFGNLIYKRPIYVIIEQNGLYYQAITDKNPQNWLSGTSVSEEFVMKLPGNIKNGKWNIYIYSPDSSSDKMVASLAFANPNIFKRNGFNYIGSFNISGGEDGNTGFYQLNDNDKTVENNAVIKKVTNNNISIDGEITDSFEWIGNEYLVNTKGKMYMKIIDNYLYLYGDINGYNAKDYYNIRVHLIVNDSDYYMTDNNYFYKGSTLKNNHVSNGYVGGYSVGTGVEYKIDISKLGITKVSDITKCIVQYIGTESSRWDVAKELSFDLYSIFEIDGKNTGNEWDDYTPIIDDDKFKLYMASSEKNIYFYGVPAKSYTYIAIQIGLKDQTGFQYLAQNGTLYKITSSGNQHISSFSNYYDSSSFEFEIPKSLFGNISEQDFKTLNIYTMDWRWYNVDSETITLP